MSERVTPSYREYEPSSEKASKALSNVSSENTEPERLLHQALTEQGLECDTHRDDLPGRPDVVFPDEGVVVFCDGDFWHGRNWKKRRKKLEEGANPEYWISKIESNMKRDERQTRELRGDGWSVVRLWEGEIKDDPEEAVMKIIRVLKQGG